MAFRKNEYQQVCIDDEYNNLSERTKRIIDKSWAKTFSDVVFPAIDEEIFSVLYSDNKASRSNTPVNFIVGALILKSLFHHTDDDLLEAICCDVRYKVALHTTSYNEQPISDRTLSRFRERLYNYQVLTGKDLLKDKMLRINDCYMKFLNLNSNIERMDSMMIASNAKRMSRLEIIYTVNANAVKLIHELGHDEIIPSGLEHYLNQDDLNETIYYSTDDEACSRLECVLKEAVQLKDAMDSEQWSDFSRYRLLIRVLDEQTNFDEEGNYTLKANKEISSSSLQNPSDPDATYRTKAGKENKGYVGNFVETIGEDGVSLITDFDLQQNTYSDTNFAKDRILKHSKEDSELTIITDGAYASTENNNLASEHGVKLVATALTGKPVDAIFSNFELNEDGTYVIKCPLGYSPEKCTYHQSTESIRVLMRKDHCEHCPNRDKCKAREQKHNYVVSVSSKMVARANYMNMLSSDEYMKLTRKRNAIEGIPSVLRRRYHVDSSPFFGKIKTGWIYTLAIGAYNFNKLKIHLPRVREKSILMPAMS